MSPLARWDKLNGMSSSEAPEAVELLDAFAKINAAPELPHLPTIVLSADKPWDPDQIAALANKVGGALVSWDEWLAAQDLLAASEPGKHVKHTDSGHFVYTYAPQLVVDAIRTWSTRSTGAARKAFLPAGNGCKMYLGCRGSGSATVVFVGGIRASAEDWLIADKSAPAVFPEVTKFTQVCAHDGPGTPVDDNRVAATRCHSRPRRGTRLPIYTPCSTACEAGSWVLVGQSYRGLIVSLYASTYPGEVSGLVLAHQLTGSERR